MKKGQKMSGIHYPDEADKIATALLWLAQAIRKGSLDSDEARTVLENLPNFAKAIAHESDCDLGGAWLNVWRAAFGKAGVITSRSIVQAIQGMRGRKEQWQQWRPMLPEMIPEEMVRLHEQALQQVHEAHRAGHDAYLFADGQIIGVIKAPREESP